MVSNGARISNSAYATKKPSAVKYNIDYYLPRAVIARRLGVALPRPPKSEAEKAADDARFSYDANQGWSCKHRSIKHSASDNLLTVIRTCFSRRRVSRNE